MPLGRRRARALAAARAAELDRQRALVDVLERVADACDRLVDRIEADGTERRALTVAVNALAQGLRALPPPPAAPRVLGGSFFGVDATRAFAAPLKPVVVVPLTDDEVAVRVPPERGVEVRCRFGDRWVDGFEVCEAIADDDRVRYRLRRRSDGAVLPTLFGADDVREVRDARPTREHGEPRPGRWSLA
jgi:hypothetical protein